MVKDYGIYIDGNWVDSTSIEKIDTVNPYNGEVLATFPKGTREDVRMAIKVAGRATPMWRNFPPPKRGEILLRAAQIMRKRKDELGTLVTQEMGKVISEGKGDVQETIDFFEYIAGEGRRLFGETTTSELPDKFAMTIRLPIGVVGLITPWNFPIAIPSWKIGAAAISGNTMVFKPSSQTPLCAAKLVKTLEEAGLPPGVLNMVTGSGSVVGDEIATNDRIRMVSFTGGIDAGRVVYKKGAERMIKIHLELGGKNPVIVMDDADLELTLDGLIFAAFGTAGQRCTAASRVIVHKDIYERFLKMLVKRTNSLKIGNPLDPSVDMGPVSSREQQETVLKYIEIGKVEGGILVAGGHKLNGDSYDSGSFIEPTVFEATREMRIAREEIFGPVLCILKAQDYEDAVSIANDIEYGLSSSIYTSNVNIAFKAMRDIEAGLTYVNAPTIGSEVHLPFGGVKNTTPDGREAGTKAIDEFTVLKTLYVDYSERLQKAQITEDKS